MENSGCYTWKTGSGICFLHFLLPSLVLGLVFRFVHRGGLLRDVLRSLEAGATSATLSTGGPMAILRHGRIGLPLCFCSWEVWHGCMEVKGGHPVTRCH
ncbi:hypothetical protein BKA70DRAFT_1339635 [Coprinopsis sp. MPI-PUGE-AT-0042]|nr:hypothetical protein BKA70DRAFT_1339635 [Coprinopsis sp. MPI-PUGE-AT-0042]